ncbi:MAG: SH3 domain-containing protein [Sulfuriferula multivorans]|uniref:SH3 domain-containing protein n=1 Tax=Sulfuriferula multivorans TaxID=1559896 RepID=A0A7C9K9C5_9PROT|nr:SH3 domain-containing protein [Sulfuriferula multivorans]
MFNTKLETSITFVVLLSVSACATTESTKSQSGTVIGGLIGAVAGALIDKNNPARGALIGGGLGAGTGYLIGKHLDEKDRAALKAKIEEMAAQNAQEIQTWRSDHSGAIATIMPIEKTTLNEQLVRVEKNVDVVIEPVPLELATGQRQATTDVNIRVGPGTEHATNNLLRQGQIVEVIGLTKDGWYVVAEGRTAVGYVSARYLKKPGEHNEPVLQQTRGPVEAKAKAVASRIEAALPPIKKKTQEVDVRVARTCRPVKVRIRAANGQVTEDTVSTCQNPDGSWGA